MANLKGLRLYAVQLFPSDFSACKTANRIVYYFRTHLATKAERHRGDGRDGERTAA